MYSKQIEETIISLCASKTDVLGYAGNACILIVLAIAGWRDFSEQDVRLSMQFRHVDAHGLRQQIIFFLKNIWKLSEHHSML